MSRRREREVDQHRHVIGAGDGRVDVAVVVEVGGRDVVGRYFSPNWNSIVEPSFSVIR